MVDYLIVGAGLFGSTFARMATDKGKRCVVVEQREHIGGNCYTENVKGINVHRYGAHIFHTNNKKVWDFVTRFAEFNNYRHVVKARHKNKIYSFPINLDTLHSMLGITCPKEAKEYLDLNREKCSNENLETHSLAEVGQKLYKTFIKTYTEKQWGRKAKNLPASIIKRVPLRYTFKDDYFMDKYQGIPIGGYTKMVENMLRGIKVKLCADYKQFKAKKIVYTGEIDALHNYKYGKLEYRTLRFESKFLQMPDYQGTAVMNFTDKSKHIRIVEHKHFEFGGQPYTIITKEFPSETGEPLYPIEDKKNLALYRKYKRISGDYVLGGRLAEYKYYNMDETIASAMEKVCKS